MTICLRCRSSAEHSEAHHPTGKVSGCYVDPDFTVTLCRACHVAEHELWRVRSIDSVEHFSARRRETGRTDFALDDTSALIVARIGAFASFVPAYPVGTSANRLAWREPW